MKRQWTMLALLVIVLSLATACVPAAPAVEKQVIQTVVVEGAPVVVEKEVVQTVVVEKVVEKEVSNVPADAKLIVWGYQSFVEGGDDAWRQQVNDFTALTGIPTEVTFINGDDMAAKYTAALEAPKTLPDILVMDSPFVPMFYEAGVLVDVSDVASELNKLQGGILPGSLAAVTFDGKQYALPYLGDVMVTFLRKDVFEAAGVDVPASYEELLAACPKIAKPGEMACWGLNLNGYGDPEFMLRGLIWSYGGRITDESGKTATLNSPETVEAFKFIKGLIDIEGGLPADAATADDYGNNLWWQEQVIAVTNNSPSILSWMQENDQEALGRSMLSAPLAGPTGQYMPVNTFTIAITTNSKYPDLAKKLFQYLAGPEREMAYIEASGYAQLPVYANLISRPVYQENEYRKPIADTMGFSYVQSWPGPPTSASTELNTQRVLSKAVVSMITDGVSPEDAVKNAHQQVEEILARHAQ